MHSPIMLLAVSSLKLSAYSITIEPNPNNLSNAVVNLVELKGRLAGSQAYIIRDDNRQVKMLPFDDEIHSAGKRFRRTNKDLLSDARGI